MTEFDREQLLAHEQLMAEIMEIRSHESKAKKPWESTAVISALTAIATVAVTSIGSYFVQNGLREGDLSIAARTEAVAGERQVMETAHLLATEALHYAGERARITSGAYRQLADAQVRPLVDSVNASDVRWRQGRNGSALAVRLRFSDVPAVAQTWDRVAAALQDFAGCSLEAATKDCSGPKRTTEEALEAFRSAAAAHVRTHLAAVHDSGR
jgi:hypothetical protein